MNVNQKVLAFIILLVACNPTADFKKTSQITGSVLASDTTPASLTISASPVDINNSNVATYSLNGTCSEEGRDVEITIDSLSYTTLCNSMLWSITEDISGASEGNFNITIDHSDASGNSATQLLHSVSKDTVNPTITITTPSNISSLNDKAYSVTGSCSENGETVSLNIGGSSTSVTCSSLAWSAIINVSGVADGAFIVTADIDDAAGNSATQASSTVRKYSLIPTSVATNVVWLDAGDSSKRFINSNCTGAAINNDDLVGCWQDKSSGNMHATMATTLQQPKLNLTTNSASIQLDGINDLYDNNRSYSARTVYLVYRIDSILQATTDLAQIWGQYSVGQVSLDARSLGTYSFDGSTANRAKHSLSGNPLTATYEENTSNAPWSYNTFVIMKTEFQNSLSITRQIIGSLFPSFSIGTHQYGGQISEILVYSSNPSASDSQKIEGYLSCKWNLQSKLPGSHPFKSVCP